MAIDKILRRHFWAVILALVAIAAFLGAQGMTQVVGASLSITEAELAAAPLTGRLPPPPSSASPHATNADAILARNPFDSVTGPLNAVAVSLPDQVASAPALDFGAG